MTPLGVIVTGDIHPSHSALITKDYKIIIAIQQRMYHKTLVSLTCGADM